VKTEITAGRTFNHDKSIKYELTGDEFKQKVPSLLQQVKIVARLITDSEKIEIGNSQVVKIGDDYSLEAKTIRTVVKNIYALEGEDVYLNATKTLLLNSDLHKIICDDSETTADNIKLNGKTNINNGNLTIEK